MGYAHGEKEKVHIGIASTQPSRSVPGIAKLRRAAFPRKAAYLVLSACCTLLFYLHLKHHTHRTALAATHLGSNTAAAAAPSSPSSPSSPPSPSSPSSPSSRNLTCRNLPGADDVLVILKTGATEIRDKLPVHLNTTLRCYPNLLLFSDYEETFHGKHVHDALEHVTPSIQDTHGDFGLWRRLQQNGRSALQPQELSGPVSNPQSDNSGKPSNPGWKLDKWKFLPMVNRTYHEYPDKKWYVFVETDTYILWQTLLNYLAAVDETKPYYIGAQIWIGDIVFAHGGTGFMVSNPAMAKVTKMFQENQAHWESFTSGHWAGDCILGKAFKDSGTPLTRAWPIWQGDDIGRVVYWRKGGEHRQWCTPTVSYHHLSPTVIKDLWEFEQEWIEGTKGDSKAFLRHKDMFSQYLMPRIAKPKLNWDNHANDDRGPVQSLEECGRICEDDEGCLQYRLTPDMRCLSSMKPMLGNWSKGVESGWIVERVQQWGDRMESCKVDDWIS